MNDGRRIPYKTYQQAGGEYATWSTTPDTSTQPYWKWFVCHFRSKLEEKYHKRLINEGKIPDAWNKITKQEVLDDLKKKLILNDQIRVPVSKPRRHITRTNLKCHPLRMKTFLVSIFFK